MLDKRKKLLQIVARDGWKCSYCPTVLTWQTATIDHIKPQSLGGSNKLRNLCLACVVCNQMKGNKMFFQDGHKKFPPFWPPYLKDF